MLCLNALFYDTYLSYVRQVHGLGAVLAHPCRLSLPLPPGVAT